MTGRLDRKVALITGAASGIGRASALLFAKEGASVSVVDRALPGAQETVAVITKARGEAIAIEADVSSAADVERMIKRTVDTYGRLDILFNNAGISARTLAFTADLSEEDWDAVLDTNLKSVFLASRLAIPIMIRQGGGVIVNTSSAQGIGGGPLVSPYCASKAGIILLTKTMAAEYAKQNIRVNCICPGMTDTPMMSAYFSSLQMDFIPQGRPGDPEEIARAALFLASDDASYVTGAFLPVDGGWSAQLVVPYKQGP
ncbi:MAG: glucose 1-dehydrogenase [Dehalococcoidia bacterium]|nr:glucose 1-dehydrogenase [Dehalococcoidia bacterium]